MEDSKEEVVLDVEAVGVETSPNANIRLEGQDQEASSRSRSSSSTSSTYSFCISFARSHALVAIPTSIKNPIPIDSKDRSLSHDIPGEVKSKVGQDEDSPG